MSVNEPVREALSFTPFLSCTLAFSYGSTGRPTYSHWYLQANANHENSAAGMSRCSLVRRLMPTNSLILVPSCGIGFLESFYPPRTSFWWAGNYREPPAQDPQSISKTPRLHFLAVFRHNNRAHIASNTSLYSSILLLVFGVLGFLQDRRHRWMPYKLARFWRGVWTRFCFS